MWYTSLQFSGSSPPLLAMLFPVLLRTLLCNLILTHLKFSKRPKVNLLHVVGGMMKYIMGWESHDLCSCSIRLRSKAKSSDMKIISKELTIHEQTPIQVPDLLYVHLYFQWLPDISDSALSIQSQVGKHAKYPKVQVNEKNSGKLPGPQVSLWKIRTGPVNN